MLNYKEKFDIVKEKLMDIVGRSRNDISCIKERETPIMKHINGSWNIGSTDLKTFKDSDVGVFIGTKWVWFDIIGHKVDKIDCFRNDVGFIIYYNELPKFYESIRVFINLDILDSDFYFDSLNKLLEKLEKLYES